MRTSIRQGLVSLFAAVAALLPFGSAAAAQAKAPLVVVSVASVDELLGDVVYLTEAAGAGDMGRLVSLMSNAFTAGLQKDKPLGLYASLEDGQPSAVLFLPVKDLRLLLTALKDQVGEPKEIEDGLLEIARDKPQPVYIKEKSGWAFASNSKSALTNVPADPARVLGGLNTKYTIAVQANIQAIPQELRAMAIEQMKRGFEEGMSRQLDARQKAVAEKLGQSWIKTLTAMIQELQYVTLGWEIDAKAHKTFLDIQVTAVEGSELAKKMASSGSLTSSFAGFLAANHAASLHINDTVGEDDVEGLVMLLGVARDEALKGLDKEVKLSAADRETAKGLVTRLLDLAEETAKAGKLNAGAALILEPSSLSFVAGGFISDGSKLEKIVSDLSAFAVAKNPGFPGVKLNAGTYGGITMHTVSVPMQGANAQAKQVLGDPMQVVLGTGRKAAFLAFGKNPEAALKGVIDGCRAKTSEKTLPAELVVSVKPILQFAESLDANPGIKAALGQLSGSGNDTITLTAIPVPRGAAVRLSVDEGVIKAAAAGVRAAQGR